MRRGKRTSMVIVMVTVVFTLCGPVLAFSGGGSGTEGDPYVITDVYQLQEMKNDLTAYYVLGNDIDASDTINWNGGAGFKPVGTFTGIFDGQGHTITGLFVDRPSVDFAGLFGIVEYAKIKNVILVDIYIRGKQWVGGLVGNMAYSTVSNCRANGSINGPYIAGGLVGRNFVGSINKSASTGSVNCQEGSGRFFGGLVGSNSGHSQYGRAYVTNCYSTSNVSSRHIQVGGLIGSNSTGVVTNCYSTGLVTCLDNDCSEIGGLIGEHRNSGCSSSYWDIETSGQAESAAGEDRTTAEMMQQATFVGWDFDEIWDIDEGQSYPYFMEPRLLEGLEITGPNEVAEDFSVQYKAIAHYDNGGTADVTALANWSIDDETVASISAGLLTTEAVDLPQDITITAEYSEGENTEAAQKQVSIFAICPSGTALSFDGVDDYVEVPDNDDSLDITDSLTISAWVNLNNIEPDNFIANKQPSGTSRKNYPGNYEFRISGGSLVLGHQTGTGGLEYSFYSSTSGIEAGTWHHVAVTLVEGGDVNFYINGSPAGTSPQSGTFGLLNDEPVRIGTRKDTWSYLDGLTDDIRIYNRALSAEEIQAIMHMKPAGADPNLVAYWAFDEGAGQSAGDSSLYGNDGTLGLVPGEDDSDPVWVPSDAPIGICSLEGIVERNLLNILGMKNDVLDILDEAIGKEEALWEYMDIVFKDRNFGSTGKGDVAKAKQKIHSAIQHEEQAESTVDKSIEKLEDALDALDIE